LDFVSSVNVLLKTIVREFIALTERSAGGVFVGVFAVFRFDSLLNSMG